MLYFEILIHIRFKDKKSVKIKLLSVKKCYKCLVQLSSIGNGINWIFLATKLHLKNHSNLYVKITR